MSEGFPSALLGSTESILETKSVALIVPMHMAQSSTLLKLTGRRVGMILNFDALPMRNGIKRVVI